MPVSETYSRYVIDVWDRLEKQTGKTVFYLDATHIASYCPACLDGTMRLGFVERPEPGFTVTSKAMPGCCSYGCSETLINEVLFG